MDSVNSPGINTNYSSCSSYDQSYEAPIGAAAEENSPLPGESSSINSFASGLGNDFDLDADLNGLYDQKSGIESDLGENALQKGSIQSEINAVKQKLTLRQEAAQQWPGDETTEMEDALMSSMQESYPQTVADRSAAQQELDQLNRQNSANDKAINSNAQQQQQTSSQISSLQGQLASLVPPAQPSGEGEGSQADYQSQLSSYESQRAELQNQINELTERLRQLQSEAQQLQNTKTQLSREVSSKQNEVAQLDMVLQTSQTAIDEYHQKRADAIPELQNAFNEDSELQALQSELNELQEQEAELQVRLAEVNAQIAEAESRNEGLQAVREQETDRAFQEAAAQTGFDAAGAEASARSSIAQERFGKAYDELTEDEKLSIEAGVDGEVTLAAMELARQRLEEDPDDAAAQAVIANGAKNLDAQLQLNNARLNNSLENLPASLREGAAAAMLEARNNAAEGSDPEIAAMEALAQYVAGSSENPDLSDEELSALQNIAYAAGDYTEALENSGRGANILESASESFAKSDLAAMKAQAAMQLGVPPDQLIVLSGTNGQDDIRISNGDNGGLCVTIGDKVYNYTKEEAKYLIIDGGAGDDYIGADNGVSQGLHIFGGAGNDLLDGGDGDDYIDGGAGDDGLYGYKGNDVIVGGSGNNTIEGNEGDDFIFGGDGSDTIAGGEGNDYIDGGAGDDELHGDEFYDEACYGGNDIILGGAGNDVISGGKGSDILLGEEGEDHIEGNDGLDIIDGGEGFDHVYGYAEGWAADGSVIFSNDGDAAGDARVIEEAIGFNREAMGADMAANMQTAQNYGSKVAMPEDEGMLGNISDIVDSGRNLYNTYIKSPWQAANGTSKCLKGAYNLYQAGKISASALPISKFGIVGGAISVFTGIMESIEGIQDGDTLKTVSGGLQALSGGLAIAACCCPVSAPACLIASGICLLIHWGIDLFNG